MGIGRAARAQSILTGWVKKLVKCEVTRNPPPL